MAARLLVVMFLLMSSVMSCSSAAGPPPTLSPLPDLVPVQPASTRAPFHTATPWPTFTPVPADPDRFRITVPTLLPTDAPRPAPTPLMDPVTAIPTPTVWRVLPTPDPQSFDFGSLVATPVRPAIQRDVPGLDLVVSRQTVFMSHYAEPPSFFPRPSTVFYTRTARYIGWWVEFDYSDVDPDFELHGTMRILNLNNGELVMHHEPVVLRHGHGLFLMLGDSVPGRLWFPGKYRFEAWDNRDRVMVHYDFEVRSGFVQ